VDLPVVFCTEDKHIVTKEVEDFLKTKVILIRPEYKVSNDELVEMIGDADGLLNMGYAINKKLLDAAPRLKAVSNTSVGYDNFDIEEMKKHNVVGLNTPNVLNESVADLVIGLMIATGRRMCELDSLVRAGEWPNMTIHGRYGLEISNKKLGIIGMGRIGEVVARKAIHAFNMEVCYCNRNRRPEIEKQLSIKYSEMTELLMASDYVVIMTPLTKQTHHLIGEAEFKLMKMTAIFVNASRGPVVDEHAMICALKNKEIWGAGLDVFEKEPFGQENGLVKLPNTVLVPHIASLTAECRFKMAMVAARGLVDFLYGKHPNNVIDEFR
jgi:gluconate 2-dehydrogenase